MRQRDISLYNVMKWLINVVLMKKTFSNEMRFFELRKIPRIFVLYARCPAKMKKIRIPNKMYFIRIRSVNRKKGPFWLISI